MARNDPSEQNLHYLPLFIIIIIIIIIIYLFIYLFIYLVLEFALYPYFQRRICPKTEEDRGLYYENMPIQIYWKYYHQKMKIFR